MSPVERILADGPDLKPAYTAACGPAPGEKALTRLSGYPGGADKFDTRQHQLRGNLPQAFVHAAMFESAARLAHPWDARQPLARPATATPPGHVFTREDAVRPGAETPVPASLARSR